MMRGSLEQKQMENFKRQEQEPAGLKLKKGFTELKPSAPSK